MFEYILEDSGSAENKEELLFSHDKLSLASILRPLHQVTKEMLVNKIIIKGTYPDGAAVGLHVDKERGGVGT